MTKRRRIDGFHATQAALEHTPEKLTAAWVDRQRRDKRFPEIEARLEKLGLDLEFVDRKRLDKLVDSRKHQGIVVELHLPAELDERALETAAASDGAPSFFLVLDCVQDPHNLGACLRTADAAGVQGIVITKDKSVAMTPTVYKVASGAAETVPIYRVTNLARSLKRLKNLGVWIIGTDGEAPQSLFETELTGSVAVVIGAEGRGLRRLTREQCDLLVRLPMLGQIESLNLSVAAGVLLYEIVRQRQNSN